MLTAYSHISASSLVCFCVKLPVGIRNEAFALSNYSSLSLCPSLPPADSDSEEADATLLSRIQVPSRAVCPR